MALLLPAFPTRSGDVTSRSQQVRFGYIREVLGVYVLIHLLALRTFRVEVVVRPYPHQPLLG
jgi:hypothetical protein